MRGLDRASTNAQDGVSSVQTAEGALTEVHSMLQRMNELAVQASNGTNSESDRKAIQDEIKQLTVEIDRVSETTKFNETYLLKGDTQAPSKEIFVAAHDAGLEGKLTDNGDGTSTFKLNSKLEGDDKVTIAGVEYTIASDAAGQADGDAAVSAADLDAKLDAAKGAGATVSVTTKDGETVSYDYKAAETVDTASLKTRLEGAFNSAQDGTEVKVGADSYTYNNAKVNLDQSANGRLDTVVTDAGLSLATAANGDTISVKNAAGTKVYTYDGTDWKDEAGTTVSMTGGSAVAAADGDEITVTLGGAATTFGIIDDSTIAGHISAGFYKDNDTTTTAITSATDLSDLVDTNSATAVTVGGKEVSVGDEIAEGWYAGDGTALDTSKLGGATVAITDAAGATETVTVAADAAAGSNVITKEEALEKIKAALTQASSIGVDDPDAVTVELNEAAGQADDDAGAISFTINQGKVKVAETLSFNLHVGADADMTNKIAVKIDTMNSAFLGVKDLDVIGNGNDGGVAATYAIDAIADAISKVSEQRSALGAVQNRLEHTIANLDNVVENTTAAESRIRDTDMAEEMVEYSKNNILAQAGQSMLAQANQSTQGVLSLLG